MIVCSSCGTEFDARKFFCPSCKAMNGGGRMNFSMGHDYEAMSPLTHQALMADKHFQERLILEGARDSGAYTVEERGPNYLRPFNNDPLERKQAQEAFNAGHIKFDDHLPGVGD